MSIDFSTLQGLTIPEGVVTQIADASGRVLWSAAKPMVTVTIDNTYAYSEYSPSWAYLMIDGTQYHVMTDNQTLEVPVGTVIECWITGESKYEMPTVYVNGIAVCFGERDVWRTYYYTVTTNASIVMRYKEDNEKDDRYGIIYIYET